VTQTEFKHLQIPAALHARVTKVLGPFGYTSHREYASEAIRRLLELHENDLWEQQEKMREVRERKREG